MTHVEIEGNETADKVSKKDSEVRSNEKPFNIILVKKYTLQKSMIPAKE